MSELNQTPLGPYARTPDRHRHSEGVWNNSESATETARTVRELLPTYLAYASHEWNLRPATLKNYREGILRLLKVVDDIRPGQIGLQEILALKADLARCGAGPNWVRSVTNGVRSFLRFCHLVLGLEVIDPKAIAMPRIPRRDVTYLTGAEVERFLAVIPALNNHGRYDVPWLRFRCLVEVLLGTGMRIHEALGVKCSAVNFETGEAEIIGKGNKQRTVYFTPRALAWIKEYLNRRGKWSDWLFAGRSGRPVCYDEVRKKFALVSKRSSLKKKVTPHILRHTCATLLLFNGCPIGHIKEILGHDQLETTCRYYLGTDKQAAKEAQRKYLQF